MHWISVNELLPDFDKNVLVWTPAGCLIAKFWEVCKCGDVEHFSDGKWCANLDEVTYWQPLPKAPPPKEKEIRITTKKRRPLNNNFNTALKKPRSKSLPNKYKFWG